MGLDSLAPLLKRTARAGNCDNVVVRNKADDDYGGIELDQIVVWNHSKTFKSTVQLRDGGAADVIFTLPRTDGVAGQVLGILAGNSALQWVSGATPTKITTTLDFGVTPNGEVSATISDAAITTTSNLLFSIQPDGVDHSADEVNAEGIRFTHDAPLVGSVKVYLHAPNLTTGDYIVNLLVF